ncbi:MAG: hypothetical protein ABI702_14275 [Burkholderiales bacterium]
MQDSLQVVDTVETPVAAPFELTTEQLQWVSGGVKTGPNDTWAVAGPNDSW